jgi:branched-chain amino acid transport system permease protein
MTAPTNPARFRWLRITNLLLLAIIVAGATLPLYLDDAYWMLVGADVCIFAILGLSYNLLLGQLGLFSLGHALFFGFAGYATAILMNAGVDMWTAIALAAAGCAVLALLIALVTIHISGIYFAIITLALAQAGMTAAQQNIFDLTGGENGLFVSGIPPEFNVNVQTAPFYWLAFGAMLIVIATVGVLRVAPMGALWAGIRDNPVRSESLGVNVRLERGAAFVIAALLAGVAGALNVLALQIASPDQLGLTIMVQTLLIVIIGGPGSFLGPVIGALLVRLSGPFLDELAAQPWMSSLPVPIERALSSHDLILGIVYILLVLFLPGGIASLVRREETGAGGSKPKRPTKSVTAHAS